MGFDSDDDSALKKAQKKLSLHQLQNDPNLLRKVAEQQSKKSKTERASLKNQVSLKELQQKLEKTQKDQSGKTAMDIKTKTNNEELQKQEKEKAEAQKQQGQTENPSQQV